MDATNLNKRDAALSAETALFERVANAKGITLSAGPAVTAAGAKVEPAAAKPLSKTAQKKADREAARKAKEAAASIEPLQVAATVNPPADEVAAPSTPVTAEPALGPDGQPLEKVRRSIVPMRFKERYSKHGGTCGDDMALELKAATTTRNADKREVLDVAALWAIAAANEIDVAKYVDLNNGQKRMNVGNKLRGRLAAGADVVIGTRQFEAEDFVPKH